MGIFLITQGILFIDVFHGYKLTTEKCMESLLWQWVHCHVWCDLNLWHGILSCWKQPSGNGYTVAIKAVLSWYNDWWTNVYVDFPFPHFCNTMMHTARFRHSPSAKFFHLFQWISCIQCIKVGCSAFLCSLSLHERLSQTLGMKWGKPWIGSKLLLVRLLFN